VSAALLQPLVLCAAFWLALWLHDRRAPCHTRRFAAALALGAVLARIGHAALFEAPDANPFDPFGAVSVLFVPLGIVLLNPSAAAFSSLPLPFALARAGCLAAGCCHGHAGALLPISGAAALCALHRGTQRLSPRWVPAAFLIAFGALRIAESDWRDGSLETSARVVPDSIAAIWIGLGLASAAATWWRSQQAQPEA